jgi:hypothetical protein
MEPRSLARALAGTQLMGLVKRAEGRREEAESRRAEDADLGSLVRRRRRDSALPPFNLAHPRPRRWARG